MRPLLTRRTALQTAVLGQLCMGVGLSSDNREFYYTNDMPNGRAWLTWTTSEKVLVVTAIAGGIAALSMLLDAFEDGSRSSVHKQVLSVLDAPNITYGDVQQELSKFYSDPANVAIPVAMLYPAAVSVLKGMSAQRVALIFEELRGVYSGASTR